MGDEYDRAFDRALRRALERVPNRLDGATLESLSRDLADRVPGQRDLLVRNSGRYGRLEVCQRLIAASFAQRHSDPERMLELALAAVAVADALSPPPGGDVLLADTRAEAHGNLANAQRVSGDLLAAEASLCQAEQCLAEGSGDAMVVARLTYLKGGLRLSQHRYPEAIELLGNARQVYDLLGEEHRAGEILISLGQAYGLDGQLDAAMRSLYQGLHRIDLGRERHLGLAAVHAMVSFLGDAGHLEDALDFLREIYPLYEVAEGGLVPLRLRWLEGRLATRLGRLPHAIRALESVRRGLAARDLPYDAALATLDLALVYARQGWLDEVQRLAAEMYPVFHSRQLQQEARAALALFVRAAETRRATEKLIVRLARRVERSRASR